MRGWDEREVFEFLDFWQKDKHYRYTKEEKECAHECGKLVLQCKMAGALAGAGLAALVTHFVFRVRVTEVRPLAAAAVLAMGGAQAGWAVAMPTCLDRLIAIGDQDPMPSPHPVLACQACLFINKRGGAVRERYGDKCAFLKSRLPPR